jgi:hypothetical protein
LDAFESLHLSVALQAYCFGTASQRLWICYSVSAERDCRSYEERRT